MTANPGFTNRGKDAGETTLLPVAKDSPLRNRHRFPSTGLALTAHPG